MEALAARPRQPNHVHHLAEAGLERRATQARKTTIEPEKLFRGQIIGEVRDFRQEPQTPPASHVPRLVAENLRPSAGPVDQTDQYLDGGRLSGAVRPQKAEDLSRSDLHPDLFRDRWRTPPHSNWSP